MSVFCDNCGTENLDNAKFCVSCGNNIEHTTKTTQDQFTSQATTQREGSSNCLWCKQSAGFKEEEGKLDSKWGVSAHKVKIYICNNCGYSHLFGLGRTIWDFD